MHQVFNDFLLGIFLQVSQFSQVSLVKLFRGLCQPFGEKFFLEVRSIRIVKLSESFGASLVASWPTSRVSNELADIIKQHSPRHSLSILNCSVTLFLEGYQSHLLVVIKTFF